MGGMMYRVFTERRPQAVIFGTKLRWWVLSIKLLKLMRSPGISVNTDSRLSTMDFIRTRPRS